MNLKKFEDHKEKLIEGFKKGSTLKEMSKEYNLGRNGISKYLKSLGYSISDRRKAVPHNPFVDLDNQNVQYWLGFLAADGTLSEEDKIALQLARKDRELLTKYVNFLGGGPKIHDVVWNTSNKKYYGNSVSFRNKDVFKFLTSLGITSNKTFILNPKLNLTSHFMRGYIDGDGTYELKSIEDRIIGRIRISTASNKMTAKIINYYLDNDLYFRYYRDNSRKSFHEVVVSKKSDVLKFLDILYLNADTYLERKYQNAVQIRNSLNNNTLNSGNQR